MTDEILSCGHPPTKRDDGSISTGYATLPDGRKVCYDCSNEMERRDMTAADKYVAYVSMDGASITTWPGGHLAEIVERRVLGNVIGGTILYVRAKTPDGAIWYGRGPGTGMYIKLHRSKAKVTTK